MWRKKQIYIYSMLLPLIVMIIVFAFLGVYPFGRNTIMAIDFASQYIDLFGFFKRSVLELDFSSFFYSFSKSIGGDMVGLWGYYLLSPFNLLYVIFPYEWLSVAATLTVLTRYAAMGATFAYLLVKQYNGLNNRPYLIPIFSTVYALNGHHVAYQMNPLWYDAMVMLPLIIVGVESVLDGSKKAYKYSIVLAITIIFQYYMAYMICLFIIMYAPFYLCRQNTRLKEKIKSICRLSIYSLLAVGVSAVVLYPIVQNLLLSKGTYTESMRFLWEWEFNPLHILSKTIIGAFDYNQMPNGLPNVYVASLAFVAFIVYFFMKEFKWQERVAGIIITMLFIVSMAHDFSNKIWHLGQTPAWFYHRFVFLTSFFIILIAYRVLQNMREIKPIIFFILCISISLLHIEVANQKMSYITFPQQIASLLLCTVVILFLYLKKTQVMWGVILAITILEVGINANVVQAKIGYANTFTFANAYDTIHRAIDPIRPNSSEFYRISKMFNRGKNDPFMHNYPGLTHFSSNMEAKTMDLFDYLGDAGSNAATNYGTGTPLTDALYGVKYVVQMKNLTQEQQQDYNVYSFTRESTRKDLYSYYNPLFETDRTRIYVNDNVLSVGFGVNKNVIDLKFIPNAPVQNQNMILQSFANEIGEEAFLTSYAFNHIELNNFSTDNPNNLSSVSLKRIDTTQPASIIYTFTPQTDDIYYISVPATLNESKNDLKLTLNGKVYEYYVRFDHRQLFNVADTNKGEEIKFEIKTDTLNALNIFNVEVVRLNKKMVDEVIANRKKQELLVSNWTNNSIEGTINITDDSTYMMTTIPYSKGWRAVVDGVEVHPIEVWDSLMAIPITQGVHQIKLIYIPYGFEIGIAVSSVSGLILILIQLKNKFWRKK